MSQIVTFSAVAFPLLVTSMRYRIVLPIVGSGFIDPVAVLIQRFATSIRGTGPCSVKTSGTACTSAPTPQTITGRAVGLTATSPLKHGSVNPSIFTVTDSLSTRSSGPLSAPTRTAPPVTVMVIPASGQLGLTQTVAPGKKPAGSVSHSERLMIVCAPMFVTTSVYVTAWAEPGDVGACDATTLTLVVGAVTVYVSSALCAPVTPHNTPADAVA